jgi:hypothetical protein
VENKDLVTQQTIAGDAPTAEGVKTMEIKNLKENEIGLIQKLNNEIILIGLTKEQSAMIHTFLGIISAGTPLKKIIINWNDTDNKNTPPKPTPNLKKQD